MLEDLRIMMPDASVRAALPSILAELAQRPRGGLQGLALVCKSGTLLSDDLLEHLAPHAAQLRRLTLLGGARLSTAGVYPLMEAARHLEKLTLDAPPYSVSCI